MRGMPPLSRRALLVGLAVTATGRRAHAQPKVFLDYDQDALDRAYDQRAWAPNMDAVLTHCIPVADVRRGAPGRGARPGAVGVRAIAGGPARLEADARQGRDAPAGCGDCEAGRPRAT